MTSSDENLDRMASSDEKLDRHENEQNKRFQGRGQRNESNVPQEVIVVQIHRCETEKTAACPCNRRDTNYNVSSYRNETSLNLTESKNIQILVDTYDDNRPDHSLSESSNVNKLSYSQNALEHVSNPTNYETTLAPNEVRDTTTISSEHSRIYQDKTSDEFRLSCSNPTGQSEDHPVQSNLNDRTTDNNSNTDDVIGHHNSTGSTQQTECIRKDMTLPEVTRSLNVTDADKHSTFHQRRKSLEPPPILPSDETSDPFSTTEQIGDNEIETESKTDKDIESVSKSHRQLNDRLLNKIDDSVLRTDYQVLGKTHRTCLRHTKEIQMSHKEHSHLIDASPRDNLERFDETNRPDNLVWGTILKNVQGFPVDSRGNKHTTEAIHVCDSQVGVTVLQTSCSLQDRTIDNQQVCHSTAGQTNTRSGHNETTNIRLTSNITHANLVCQIDQESNQIEDVKGNSSKKTLNTSKQIHQDIGDNFNTYQDIGDIYNTNNTRLSSEVKQRRGEGECNCTELIKQDIQLVKQDIGDSYDTSCCLSPDEEANVESSVLNETDGVEVKKVTRDNITLAGDETVCELEKRIARSSSRCNCIETSDNYRTIGGAVFDNDLVDSSQVKSVPGEENSGPGEEKSVCTSNGECLSNGVLALNETTGCSSCEQKREINKKEEEEGVLSESEINMREYLSTCIEESFDEEFDEGSGLLSATINSDNDKKMVSEQSSLLQHSDDSRESINVDDLMSFNDSWLSSGSKSDEAASHSSDSDSTNCNLTTDTIDLTTDTITSASLEKSSSLTQLDLYEKENRVVYSPKRERPYSLYQDKLTDISTTDNEDFSTHRMSDSDIPMMDDKPKSSASMDELQRRIMSPTRFNKQAANAMFRKAVSLCELQNVKFKENIAKLEEKFFFSVDAIAAADEEDTNEWFPRLSYEDCSSCPSCRSRSSSYHSLLYDQDTCSAFPVYQPTVCDVIDPVIDPADPIHDPDSSEKVPAKSKKEKLIKTGQYAIDTFKDRFRKIKIKQ